MNTRFSIFLDEEQAVELSEILLNLAVYEEGLMQSLQETNYWDGCLRLSEGGNDFEILDEVGPMVRNLCLRAVRDAAKGKEVEVLYFSSPEIITIKPLSHDLVHLAHNYDFSIIAQAKDIYLPLLEYGRQYIQLLNLLSQRHSREALRLRIVELNLLADEARAALVANGYLDG